MEYGRIHVLQEMSKLASLVSIGADILLEESPELDHESIPGDFGTTNVIAWSPIDWDGLLKFLVEIFVELQESTASSLVLTEEVKKSKRTPKKKKKHSPAKLNKQFGSLDRAIQLHKAFAVFRKSLETQLADEDLDPSATPKIRKDHLKEFA